jgi:hypothetical protein
MGSGGGGAHGRRVGPTFGGRWVNPTHGAWDFTDNGANGREPPGWNTGTLEVGTNAFMEGLNSVFSAVKRKARGFRSSVYLITVLYLVAGKLRLPHR